MRRPWWFVLAQRFAPILSVLPALSAAIPSYAGETVVTVLDAGTGEKRELRLTPKVGSRQSVEMTWSGSIARALFGWTGPAEPMPTSVVAYEVRVTRVEPNGDIHLSSSVRSVKLPPDGGEPLPGLVGSTSTSVLSSRGVILSNQMVSAATGDNVDALELAWQNMLGTNPSFPEEPVGVGARWEVRERLHTPTVDVDQTTVYTLVSWKGNKAALTKAITQTAAPQALSLPDLPSGSSASLETLSGSGSGLCTVDLRSPIVASAQSEYKQDLQVRASAAGKVAPMGMQVTAGVALTSK
jgi:hypothetical protein